VLLEEGVEVVEDSPRGLAMIAVLDDGANVQDRIRVIYLPFGPRGSGFQIATPMILARYT
jgi:hypothetical protein